MIKMNSKANLFSKKILCAILAVAFICFGGCSKAIEIPDVNEYFSTEFDVKSFKATNIRVDIYDVSEINGSDFGSDFSELSLLACYNGKLYLTQDAVAENNFEEAKTGRIIEYDLKTKTAKTIVESSLPTLLPSDEDSEKVPDIDDLIFIDYRDMGFYDNKLFFVKTSSYALAGSFLDGKVYFDDKYDYSAEGYSSDVYSYDLKSKTVSLEKKFAEAPIAYDEKILCYSDDGFYTLNDEFVFSPNNSDFIDVSEARGGSILSFCNPVYDESGECANGSAVGYYDPDSFERNYILTSAAEALYFADLVSAGDFIAWGASDPSPITFADAGQGDVIILSSEIAYYRSFVDDKRLNVVSFDLNDNGFPSFFTVYSVEF